ncbi:D-serine ammonia-lyase [Niallia sp. NCCP-28]|uniref:D-serine ammonia-lyase n=1 Tax=Niallia sp. NCCP-28 TaxID=2934712 RepID=UPI00207FCA08|nr:D-serine ammonia-lyase [Niallia sp. NCCP-28]GKU83150.1 putative D-serine dehydratase [Niallia sp. NCCP-28]
MKKMIKKQLLDNSPLVRSIIEYQEVCWINEGKSELPIAAIKEVNIEEAIKRLQRFAPVIAEWFPETRSDFGLIESPLQKIPLFKQAMEKRENQKFFGNWFVKSDHQLPISGSVKARGGIYEVLKFAEKLALEKELIDQKESYRKLLSPSIKSFFADFTIIVGSTGNLGLSIGIIGRKLGFQVVVHMSKDAKTWKKNKLKEIGATVIEHDADYSVAVEQGRKEAEKDSFCYFIDDENSTHLFEGYATAAYRLKEQLHAKQIIIDENHPLFVYLPCGVGGAPGGISYGLKKIFHEHVHCFFAEPTHSPAMLTRLYTNIKNIAVQDLQLDNQTEADGLAVGKASEFVADHIGSFISGCYTISDHQLFCLQALLFEAEKEYLEPSALAGFYGPLMIKAYTEKENLCEKMSQSTHVFWGTGGMLVPEEIRKKQLDFGKTML